MVLVMDTFGLQFCMPLIMAMSMESLKVRKCLCASQTEREDVIYFYQIPILEVQPTISTSPFIAFQQLSDCAVCHGMLSQSLCPIDEITIIGACYPPNLDVALDGSMRISPEGHLFRPECPPLSLVQ